MRRRTGWSLLASAPRLFASAACLLTSVAQAHAPEARGVAVTRDARAIAVALPGFGLLVRTAPAEPFSYVCDALLNTLPSDVVTPMAFVSDGSLLVGTGAGLRIVEPTGCPRSAAGGELSDAPVFALAVSSSSPEVAYAATAGSQPGVWRSGDAGRHWQLRSPLVGAQLVTALHVHPDQPDVVYVSQGIPQGRSTLRVSSDGGASFVDHEQDRALTLLHVQSGTPTRLWVVGRDAQSVGNRGFAISRGEAPAGPWLSKQRVNYFGGFAVDEHGAITIGDESGGLFRSLDDGQTFTTVSADSAVSCLSGTGDVTWACNIGTTMEPALTSQVSGTSTSTHVVAFADVSRMVSCAPALEVERHCALAWFEWQRDVLMRNLTSQDAGAALDAGASSADAGPGDASPEAPLTAVDAAHPAADATAPTPSTARAHDGCSLAPDGTHGGARWLALVLSLVCVRRRRQRGSSAPPSPASVRHAQVPPRSLL